MSVVYINQGQQAPVIAAVPPVHSTAERLAMWLRLAEVARDRLRTRGEVIQTFRMKLRLCGALPSGKGARWPVGFWERIERKAREVFYSRGFPELMFGLRAQAADTLDSESSIREYLTWWAGCIAFLKIGEEISQQPLTEVIYCSNITEQSANGGSAGNNRTTQEQGEKQ